MEELRPARELTWDGPIHWYPAMSARESQLESGQRLAQEYAVWLHSTLHAEVPALAASLCFLDVAVTDGSPAGFRGILVAPDQERQDVYRTTVELLDGFDRNANRWVGESRSVRSHTVFQSGLPKFQDSSGSLLVPETLVELHECLRSESTAAGVGYLLWAAPTGEKATASRSSPVAPAGGWTASFIESKPEDLQRRLEDASRYPVRENWHIWTECLAEKREQLASADGNPLAVVLGVPVCIGTPATPDTEQVGQIFIGTSGPLAAEYARQIVKVVRADLLSSWIEGQAEAIRKLRKKAVVAHRLPGTINMLMAQMQQQTGSLPPVFHQLQAAALMAMGRAPRWTSYEEQCREQGWRLTRDVVASIWNEIAGPLAEYRVQTDPDPEYRRNWNQVPLPILSVTGSVDLPGRELECAALVSLLVPLLSEAYQHSLIWLVQHRDMLPSGSQGAVVDIVLSTDEVIIDNLADFSWQVQRFEQGSSNQRDEIDQIQNVVGYWNVKYPSVEDVARSGRWQVTCHHGSRPH